MFKIIIDVNINGDLFMYKIDLLQSFKTDLQYAYIPFHCQQYHRPESTSCFLQFCKLFPKHCQRGQECLRSDTVHTEVDKNIYLYLKMIMKRKEMAHQRI